MALPRPSDRSTALVTGASSGIGRAFAHALAERGHGVTLVARRADRLEEIADELRRAFGIRAEVVPTDLTDQSACERLVEEIDRRELVVEVLVNNAGFGIYAPFASSDLDREFEQLALLIGAVVHLNGRYLPRMLERGSGAIVNVSSTAGFQPLPGNGTYSASKAFVLMHSEALHAETRGSGVTVTAVCPGPVRTGFQETSEPIFSDHLPGLLWCSAERVARDALAAVERGKRTVVPGGIAARAFFGPNRIIPASLSLPVTRRLMAGELGRAGRRGAVAERSSDS
jgi:short-subunit dehydrogenase